VCTSYNKISSKLIDPSANCNNKNYFTVLNVCVPVAVIFALLLSSSGTVVLGECNKLVSPCDDVLKDWTDPEALWVAVRGECPDPGLAWFADLDRWLDPGLFWLVEVGFVVIVSWAFDTGRGDGATLPDLIICSPLEYFIFEEPNII